MPGLFDSEKSHRETSLAHRLRSAGSAVTVTSLDHVLNLDRHAVLAVFRNFEPHRAEPCSLYRTWAAVSTRATADLMPLAFFAGNAVRARQTGAALAKGRRSIRREAPLYV